jgi:hypothetical protein
MRQGVARALLCAASLASLPASAEVAINVNIAPPPPIVLAAPPPLVVVPALPAVQYVPSLGMDLFFHRSRWYYWHGGHWFVGPAYGGPWTYIAVTKVPRPVLAVPVKFYKAPPGHAKKLHGRTPPGHAKGHGKGRD